MVLGAIIESFERQMNSWYARLVEVFPRFMVAVLVLVFAWLLAKGMRRLVTKSVHRASGNEQVARWSGLAVKIVIIITGLVIALGALNLSRTVTSLLAGAGILGLALGFAFQDIAANMVSGIIIILRKPFKRGDMVETNGYSGVVKTISIRDTELRTFTGQIVSIPNRDIFQKPLTNFSETGLRRVDVVVGVAYKSDLDQVERVAKEAIKELDGVDDSYPVEVFFSGFNQSSIDAVVRCWMRFSNKQADYLALQSRVIKALQEAFARENINIPFPIRTLDLSRHEDYFRR